nr:MAG TPA: hypothetical protein [Microviridae sp.]
MSADILCEKPSYILNPAFRAAVLSTGHYVQDKHYECRYSL